MKNVLVCLLTIFLFSCSTADKNVINDNQNIEEEVHVENSSLKDDGDIGESDFSLASFEPGSNWLCDNGDYTNDLDNQFIYLESNSTANLKFDELYLFPSNITISFDYHSDNLVETKFEIFDDNDELLLTKSIVEGQNIIEFENLHKLYSGFFNFEFITSEMPTNISINHFKVKYDSDNLLIRLNQVGYQNESRKIAVFPYHQGDYFDVIDANNNQIIMTLPLTKDESSSQTNEYVSRGDFTRLKSDGTYYLESSMGFKSHNFKVSNDVYEELLDDALNFFALQKCGVSTEDNSIVEMSHDVCHNDIGIIYSTKEEMDVSGGWHDAGDYGRYVETGVKSLSDLLLAYLVASEGIKWDYVQNDMPSILAEAKYELEWLMKMQNEDGGVRSRAVTRKFPGNIMPEDDDDTVYVLSTSTSSTAGLVAVMAIASHVYRDFDSEFADMCLESAISGYDFLTKNEERNPLLPSGFSAGSYSLPDEKFYRFYANISLWYATDDEIYLDNAFDIVDEDYTLYNVYWEPLMAYPSFIYLLKADKNELHYEFVSKNFYSYLDFLCAETGRDSYRISLYDNYGWGSNQNVIDRAMILLMGYHLSGKRVYKAVAEEHLDYILGKNFHDMCFVVGYGDNYPHNIHHRIAINKNAEFKGALVGGPNAYMDDPIIQKMFEGTEYGPARFYVDDEDSYSTNEVAIHFNSALVFVLNYLNQGE